MKRDLLDLSLLPFGAIQIIRDIQKGGGVR